MKTSHARPRLAALSAATAAAALLFTVAGQAAVAARTRRPVPPARVATLNAATQSALAALYASALGIPRRDIGSIRPGSLHAAYQRPPGREWATASFLPAADAPAWVLDRFQDGASIAVFTRTLAGRWRITRAGGVPLSCPGALPAVVQRAWRLTSTAGCPASGRTGQGPRAGGTAAVASALRSAITRTAQRNVGVGDRPASTDFGFDCNPYTALAGVGASSRHCSLNRHFNVRNENELWCADFAKWVWKRGGVASRLTALTPAASSFYTWGKLHGEPMRTDSHYLRAGDAVVFYPAGSKRGARYADHVGLVVAVHAGGRVDLVNGDFVGRANITVQANGNVSLASWAAAIWGKGETWVRVGPRR